MLGKDTENCSPGVICDTYYVVTNGRGKWTFQINYIRLNQGTLRSYHHHVHHSSKDSSYRILEMQLRVPLLWTLFYLIRHGLAHQYQQILVQLSDRTHFFITLTGADYRSYLGMATNPRPSNHLGFYINSVNLGLLVYPQLLFLDFKEAISRSGLLNRNLSFPYLHRTSKSKRYNFGITALHNSLRTCGHIQI